MGDIKNFEDFRDNWLSNEKLQEIKNQSLEEASKFESGTNSFMATFSATHSVLVLSEYHDWLNQ